MKPVYKRVLLKLSGEVLAGGKGSGIDFDKVEEVCKTIKECVDLGVEVAIVVGAVAAKWIELAPTIWVCLLLQSIH